MIWVFVVLVIVFLAVAVAIGVAAAVLLWRLLGAASDEKIHTAAVHEEAIKAMYAEHGAELDAAEARYKAFIDAMFDQHEKTRAQADDHHEEQLRILVAEHQAERTELINAVVARHAGELALLTRTAQEPDTIAAQARVMEELRLRDLGVDDDEVFRDPQTNEPMHLIGTG